MKLPAVFLNRSAIKRRYLFGSIAALVSIAPLARAQFAPGPNPVNAPIVVAQTLSTGTGEVTSTGSITVGGGTNAVTLGNAVGQTYILNNAGTIDQTATGRALRNNVNTSNITITNAATGIIRTNNADAFQIAQPGSSVTLENSGQILSLNTDNTGGDQAIDWNAITTGANSLINLASGIIRANAADAVRPGTNGTITNFGLIEATPVLDAGSASSSDAVDLQAVLGVVVDNSGTIRGRHGVTGGANVFNVTVINRSGGTLIGINGGGVNIDGLTTTSTASVTNLAGGVITGTTDAVSANGDGDGVDVDGVLTLINAGTVQGLGAKGVDSGGLDNNSEGVAAGGGTITNLAGGIIIGQTTTGNPAREGRGILVDDGSGGAGVAVTTITNAGTIRGVSGFAVKLVGNFADEITNAAGGVIRGAGVGAAVQMGAGNDRLVTGGLIQGDNGLAIDLEGGDDTLVVTGGSIIGQVDGGTGSNTLVFSVSEGQTFSIAGQFVNFNGVNVSAGTTTLSGANTFLSQTTVNGGSLLVTGTMTTPLTLINHQGLLGGTGFIVGDVTNHGVVSPGLSPGKLTIIGNYRQSRDGTLRIEVGGTKPGQFDQLVVSGTASLDGLLQVVKVGKAKIKAGDRLEILTAGGGVSGEFSDVENDFATGTILTLDVEYRSNSVVIEFEQGSYENFAVSHGLSENQVSVARALDEVNGDRGLRRLFEFLGNERLEKLPGDFDRIAPEELTSVFAISTSLAAVQSLNLQRRTDDLRRGASGFSAGGLAMQGTGPGYSGAMDFRRGAAGPSGKESKELKQVTPEEEKRWGAFLTGVGEWVDVDGDGNARGYDITTGGFTLGLDYKVSPNFAIGVMAGYAGTSTDLTDDGRVWVNGGKLGLYATAFAGGWYADAAVNGGYNSYDMKRSALQGTARGDTDGGELNVLVGAGYDWKIGALQIGPTASFNYTLVGMEGYTEHGSLAPLEMADRNAESVRTEFGLKASLDWRVGGVIIRPEVRAAWQHEYGDSSYGLDASFADGDAGGRFLVNGPEIGRDSLLLGAGFAVQFSETCSTYVFYDGELGRERYERHSISGGVRVAF